MGRADDLLIYLIAFIILAVIVGIILVWVIVSAVRKRGQSSPQRGADPKPVPMAMPPVPAPAVVENMESPADKEVLRVLRDMSSGAIYLEVDGRVYRSITDIRSPEVSRLVQQVAADITRFSRNVTPAVSGAGSLNAHAVSAAGQPGQATRIPGQTAKPASLMQAHDNSTPPSSAPATGSLARRGEALINPSAPPRPPAETATAPAPPPTPRLLNRTSKLGSLPGVDPPKRPITGPLSAPAEARVDLGAPKDSKPKVDLKSFWGRALSSPNTAPGIAGPRPLADELEDVLQQLLYSLTTPPPFAVHFRTASDGRLLIDIDGVSYPGLDAIEDPSAKQLVQIIIKKWEAG